MLKLYKNLTKPTKKDFDESMLPTTRGRQFFDILKIRFVTLLGIGCLMFLFFLPTLFVILVKDNFIAVASQNFSGEELKGQVAFIYTIYSAILIPCFMIFSLGIAGSIKVLIKLIFGEPLFFKDDFIKGIKENFKHYLLISFLLGLFNLFGYVIRFYLVDMEFLSYVPMGINLTVVFPIIYVFLFVDEMYSNNFVNNIKLTCKIFVRSLLSTLLICLVLYSIYFITFIPSYFIKYIIIVFYLIFILPIIMLAACENEIRIFDKFINKEYFKEYYFKGLYIPNELKKEMKREKKND